MRQLIFVLQVMSSVEVLPIMHMIAHTKNSAGLITYDSPLETDSFDSSSRIPEKPLLCHNRFQQTLVHKDSFLLRFVQIHLIGMNIVCRPLCNPDFVQVTFWTCSSFIHRLLALLSTHSATHHFFVMYTTPNTSVTMETFQLYLGLSFDQSIAEIMTAS